MWRKGQGSGQQMRGTHTETSSRSSSRAICFAIISAICDGEIQQANKGVQARVNGAILDH